jgi:hypothetical protein
LQAELFILVNYLLLILFSKQYLSQFADFLRAQYASAFTKLPKWLPMVQNSPCCQDWWIPPLKESMNVIATEEGFAMLKVLP